MCGAISRDNRQHRIRHQQVAPFYSGAMARIYSGVDTLLDRLTHHVHILEMNGESYRLNQSQKRRKSPKIPA